ncbi:P-loop containing nucleoside triphosphate hydrolase protein [Crucibulum laeve]|uniref:P-loop containing nucleoside triphosphate hydrolase protein n=1 Tax=Crucibulum laeve TaxID=68775 RepID=A0A5C3MKS4_9AGAR|nr:P-loop containing nucleoside triphosphate hydrolase protein [Crucibulum laeve]
MDTRALRILDSVASPTGTTTMGNIPSTRIHVEKLSKEHEIIVVIGPTGAGKSSFINRAAMQNILEVGHKLHPCTKEVDHVECTTPSKKQVVFVDTPSFSEEGGQKSVEKKIGDWLKRVYGKKIMVSGIIYLHRITDKRLTEPPYSQYEMFRKLCGESFHGRVVLVTTMWSDVKPDVGSRREKEIIQNWGQMLHGGSAVLRFNDTAESAWDIVQFLLQPMHRN